MTLEHYEIITIKEVRSDDGVTVSVEMEGDSDRAGDDEEITLAFLVSNALYNLFMDGTVFAKIKADYGIVLSGNLKEGT
jgi:hypothetical protein